MSLCMYSLQPLNSYTPESFLHMIYYIVCSRLSVGVDGQRADTWKMAIQTGRKNEDNNIF